MAARGLFPRVRERVCDGTELIAVGDARVRGREAVSVNGVDRDWGCSRVGASAAVVRARAMSRRVWMSAIGSAGAEGPQR